MSDFFSSLLGLNLPQAPAPTPDQQAQMDQQAQQAQANGPLWKQLVDRAVSGGVGLFKGATGLGDQGPAGPTATNFGQVLAAGMPFAGYAAKGINEVYHGTPGIFQKFDPSRYDKGDVLGWMTHFAENPEYSTEYAKGTAKHSYYSGEKHPNLIVAKPQAKNVLDLVDPNIDDLAQALAAAPEEHRRELIGSFKAVRRQVRDPQVRAAMSPKEIATQFITPGHLPRAKDLDPAEIPARVLADQLRLGPEEFKKTPFDAIRYHDMSEKSWAVPAETPVVATGRRFIYGIPDLLKDFADTKDPAQNLVRLPENTLIQDPGVKPLPVIKSDKTGGGTLSLNRPDEIAPWENVPKGGNVKINTHSPQVADEENPPSSQAFEAFTKTDLGKTTWNMHAQGLLTTKDYLKAVKEFQKNIVIPYTNAEGATDFQNLISDQLDLPTFYQNAEKWHQSGLSKTPPSGSALSLKDMINQGKVTTLEHLMEHHAATDPNSISHTIKAMGSNPQDFFKKLGIHVFPSGNGEIEEPEIYGLANAYKEGKLSEETANQISKEFLPKYPVDAWKKWLDLQKPSVTDMAKDLMSAHPGGNSIK